MIASIRSPRRGSSDAGADQALDDAVAEDVDGQHLLAERRLRRAHDAVVVGARMVELGDDHGARHADGGTLPPQLASAVVDAFVGGDHEQRAISGAEPGPHLADEVGVAGGVDEIDLGALEHDRGDGKGDGPMLTEGHLRECLDQGGLT